MKKITKKLQLNNFIMITTDKRFIGEIEGFTFPNGILNKKIAGAGATEFAIRNDEPTVILSPRLGLIESKVNQHPELLEVKSGVTVEDIRAFGGLSSDIFS